MTRRIAVSLAAAALVAGAAFAWAAVPVVVACQPKARYAGEGKTRMSIPLAVLTPTVALESLPNSSSLRNSIVTVLGVRSHETLRTDASGKSRRGRSLASGVVVDAKGRIVTVATAVRDCDAIVVRAADGREFPAMLLGLDEDTDVALLQVPTDDLTALRYAIPGSDPVGQPVAVLGSGVGGHPKESAGEVRRTFPRPLGSLLLLSNPVYPGTSGGAAVNAHGELVGLIVGSLAETPADWTDAPQGAASFAVRSDDLKTIVGQLERFGAVRRGFLGVRMTQGEIVDAERPGEAYKIGVRAEEVLVGGPAAHVGLRPGDLIVGWNGETLQSPEDLMRRVEGSPPGTIVPLVWVRNDERHEGKLVVGARPDAELLATPAAAGAAIDSAREAQSREQLLEKVRTLRAKPPGAADSSRTPRDGG